MALRLSNVLKNAIVDNIVTKLAGATGTAGSARLDIYTGAQPTTAGGTASGTLLCTISPVNWLAGTGGTSILGTAAAFTGTSVAAGTAGWARCADGTAVTCYMIDGAVATSGQTFTIDGVVVASGAVITLTAATIYQG